MGLLERLDALAQKMRWYDISLVKGATFAFTLFLVTAWDGFRTIALGISWQWYLLIAAIFSAPLLYKLFKG